MGGSIICHDDYMTSKQFSIMLSEESFLAHFDTLSVTMSRYDRDIQRYCHSGKSVHRRVQNLAPSGSREVGMTALIFFVKVQQ